MVLERLFGHKKKASCLITVSTNDKIKNTNNNSEMLLLIHEYIAEELPDVAEKKFLEVIGMPFHKHFEVLQDYCQQIETAEMLLGVLDVVDVSGLRREIESAILKVSDWPFEYYRFLLFDRIGQVHKGYPLNNFLPSENIVNTEKNTIQYSLTQNVNTVTFLHDLSEIQNYYTYLVQRRPAINKLLEDSQQTDWSYLARSFGSGALIAVNPFIGIPAAIANYASKQQSGAQKRSEWIQFIDKTDEYLKKWAVVQEHFIQMYQTQQEYYVNKTVSMIQSAFCNVLAGLSEHGCTLLKPEKYFRG